MRKQCDDSLAAARRDHKLWESYVKRVARVVRVMPLHKLQTIGRSRFEFLYTVPEPEKFPGYIQLNPGIAYNFRRFYGLVKALIQEAWTNYIRKLEANQPILGQVTDLEEFLFGSERADLGEIRQILVPFQEGRCFYCDGKLIGEKADVDHFIPWMRYASDLGHNFVVAHSSCNNNKRELLAGIPHLKRWVQRNSERGEALENSFHEHDVLNDLSVSAQIARWAYDQAEVAGSILWISKNKTVTIDGSWRSVL
jgi:5-methylcytosine-specific restriction endonuclease McrA